MDSLLAPVAHQARDEHVDALLEPARDAHDAPHRAEAGEEARQVRHAPEDVLRHHRDALDLPEVPRRLLGEGPMLLEQRLHLGGQGLQLVIDGHQRLLRRPRGPGDLEQGRDERDHQGEKGQAGNQSRYL